MNCPNCGAGLKIQNGKAVCEYCGHEEPLPDYTKPGSDDFFNLVVTNESYGGDTITISIPDCNMGFIIRSGEAVAKDVPAGYHTLVVTSGGMTEYRSVLIPSDGRAVKVFISVMTMGINIRVDEPGGVNRYAGNGSRIPNEKLLPVLALILSIMIPLVGFIIACVDISNCKNREVKPSGLTTAALVISIIRFFSGFAFLSVMGLAGLN